MSSMKEWSVDELVCLLSFELGYHMEFLPGTQGDLGADFSIVKNKDGSWKLFDSGDFGENLKAALAYLRSRA